MKGPHHQVFLPMRLKNLTVHAAVREGFLEELTLGSERRRYLRLREQQVEK